MNSSRLTCDGAHQRLTIESLLLLEVEVARETRYLSVEAHTNMEQALDFDHMIVHILRRKLHVTAPNASSKPALSLDCHRASVKRSDYADASGTDRLLRSSSMVTLILIAFLHGARSSNIRQTLRFETWILLPTDWVTSVVPAFQRLP